jgi:hypothetical protein
MKARGFVERSGMVICGGLPTAEMPLLNAALPFSRAEQDLLTGWTAPPAFDTVAGKETEPPGRGNFLVKVGGRPGIPVHVTLTSVEKDLNDTNRLWHDTSRAAPLADVIDDVAHQDGLPVLLDPDEPNHPDVLNGEGAA